jgi:outer membrane lipoprotein SlyB
MKLRSTGLALVAVGALTLGGCATYEYDAYGRPYAVYDAPGPIYRAPPVVAQRVEYGVVERIDLYRGGSSSPIGIGTILGGLAGGILGHQIGAGSGNTAATIAGAVGGAVVGNQIEQAHAGDRYRVWVRTDSGAMVGVDDVAGELRVGDRVRIVNGRVTRI